MASAVLSNRNESNWTQPQARTNGGGGGGAKFMGKHQVPFSNPNPNPKFSKKRQFQPVADIDESPFLMQSAASDDASSINRRPNNDYSSSYVTFNVSSYSRKELVELKNRLIAELERIRLLKSRIDSTNFQIRSINKKQQQHPIVEPNKKATGNKRPFPTAASSNMKDGKKEHAQLMKSCSSILQKLMRHKHGKFIFNSPVDVVSLKLHDYYDVIKNPMDLGTVKSKLVDNQYNSPRDFAADVRLTFSNAMKYNPKGHEVYNLAYQLLTQFEDLFRRINDKMGPEVRDVEQEDEPEDVQVREVQASSWDYSQKKEQENFANPTPKTSKSPVSEHIVSSVPVPTPAPNPPLQSAVRTPSPMRAPPVKPLKQPKPKAKDPNKREMSLEEKHKLGVGLQNLPQEKMEHVVQIIRKRNGHLRQEGDEIELDIEAVDTETLWELDRFVTNYKKMVSKIKRQALMGLNNNNAGSAAAVSDGNKEVPGNEMEVATEEKKPKKGEAGDEDVDIGDEMPTSNFPPVEIEKDNGGGGHASSSSSSSSSSSDDSSSSSDSDSGSSSGSDSEDAHS